MKITDALLGEHAVFYAQFEHMENIVPNTTDVAYIKIHAAMLAAALHGHAHVEDDMLFPHLEPFTDTQDLLAVMGTEHVEIGNLLDQIGDIQDLDDAKDMLLSIIFLARNHFAKEEQALFPLVEKSLSENKLSALGSDWAQYRSITLA